MLFKVKDKQTGEILKVVHIFVDTHNSNIHIFLCVDTKNEFCAKTPAQVTYVEDEKVKIEG